MNKYASQGEHVLLVHGLASMPTVMWPLAARLRGHGYSTGTWGYFSIRGSVHSHGAALAKKVKRLADSGRYRRVHLVVHSMGSILTRCALERPETQALIGGPLGRVVMIGPPNGGSHVATQLTPVYGWLSPTLVELSDKPDSVVNQLPPPPAGVEIGVLAATRDNVVRPERTHLPGQRDHRFVRGWHTGVLWTRETAEQAAAFLKTGAFLGSNAGRASA